MAALFSTNWRLARVIGEYVSQLFSFRETSITRVYAYLYIVIRLTLRLSYDTAPKNAEHVSQRSLPLDIWLFISTLYFSDRYYLALFSYISVTSPFSPFEGLYRSCKTSLNNFKNVIPRIIQISGRRIEIRFRIDFGALAYTFSIPNTYIFSMESLLMLQQAVNRMIPIMRYIYVICEPGRD